jgi:hypothetical protein
LRFQGLIAIRRPENLKNWAQLVKSGCNGKQGASPTPCFCDSRFAALELGIPTQQSELDLPRADDIKINDLGPVMRAVGNGIDLVPMNFSFQPTGPRGGPVFNFRSEGRRLDKSNRCLIPASAFFEFTGKKYPKAKHRFTLRGSPFLAIAGIWRDGKGDAPPAFTMLTTEPRRAARDFGRAGGFGGRQFGYATSVSEGRLYMENKPHIKFKTILGMAMLLIVVAGIAWIAFAGLSGCSTACHPLSSLGLGLGR